MGMYIREHDLLKNEIKDMLIADLALTLAFAVIFARNAAGFSLSALLYYIPISFVAVSLSFILHEYMHKKMAQKYGAIAAFKKSDFGILITLVSSMFGFLLGIPGATVIYTSTFTRKEEGIVSLAGPLTNFAVFAVFFLISISGVITQKYLQDTVSVTLFISILLAFFNMLPIYPLDGSKVFRWNKIVYVVMLGVTFAILAVIIGLNALFFSLIFMLAVALFFSLAYRSIRLI